MPLSLFSQMNLPLQKPKSIPSICCMNSLRNNFFPQSGRPPNHSESLRISLSSPLINHSFCSSSITCCRFSHKNFFPLVGTKSVTPIKASARTVIIVSNTHSYYILIFPMHLHVCLILPQEKQPSKLTFSFNVCNMVKA